MRELKFRCWNGEDMISPDGINRDGFAYWKENSIPSGTKEVMQFTGLKDKDGKEIWEGDKIRRTANMRDYAECDGVDIQDYEVEYCGYYFHPFLECGTRMEEYEVIGNIYENPKLIKGEIK